MGWKEKHISKVGREVLIKTVAQAIPTYSMSMFKLPKKIYDDINSVLAKYWWGQTQNEKKIHWINWGKLCKPKDKGGMSFRDIHAFNLAMLAKQAWRLIQGGHSLFVRVYKALYFPSCSFMEVELGCNPSFVWRSLLDARELIRAGIAWHMGDGQSIEVNDHRWLNHPPLFRPSANTNLKVADLIDHRSRQWNRALLYTTFLQSTMDDILRIKLGEEHDQDKLLWKETKSGCFSVKTAYWVALHLNQPQNAEHSTTREDYF
ncbi:uncharacterized protein LOC115973779 [Quercus lobata]|uniref:uncharacterized protein LOC115973779 n=1 Tax=Quercus lobata TaxID=97700 RepID=UPI001248DB36|nr:uncharacterized protein LOC115973779 [Quercus lobata]